MRNIVRWDPLAEFASLRRAMDRVFDEPMGVRTWLRPDTTDLTFPIDLYETDNSVVVKAALPGLKPDDVDISMHDGALTIKGESKQEEETKEEGWYRREIRYGSFMRSVPLPVGVISDKAEAKFKDGLLTVTLPKAEESVAKTIKVKAA